MIRKYLLVMKPGILLGNMITISGGYFLASGGRMDISVLLPTIIGISLVIASACVINNYIDRDLDRQMVRTRNRVLAKGDMLPKVAAVYGSVLGVGGAVLLLLLSNLLTFVIVLGGVTVYVGIYSLYMKRNSVHAPLIGSLAGAAPPVAGYCAVTDRFDMGALILVLIFALWQIPHFYAIAIYRMHDYAAAAIPVLPVKKGVTAAKNHIIGYIAAFTVPAVMLRIAGYAGDGYLLVSLVLCLGWLTLASTAHRASDDRKWARTLFACSIVIIFFVSAMMSIDPGHPRL